LKKFLTYALGFLCIAVVFVVLAPVLVTPNHEHKTLCLSNLKQIATGTLIYVSDYDERYPPAADWSDSLAELVRRPSVFYCPVLRKEVEWGYGYAYNSRASSALIPEDQRATFPLVYDSINLAPKSSDPFTSFPSEPRHESGNNIAYADGHVKRVSSAKP